MQNDLLYHVDQMPGNRFLSVCILLTGFILAMGSTGTAQEFYEKKTTWQETMLQILNESGPAIQIEKYAARLANDFPLPNDWLM